LAEVDVLLGFAGKTRKDVREVLQVYQSHFLVESDLDVLAVHHSNVDLVLQEHVAGLFGIAHLDSQGVKRVLALGNSQTKFLAVVAQDLLEVIKSFSNVKESLGSVPDGVES